MAPLRERIAGYYNERFGLDINMDQVIVGPGSKELIAIALTVLQGSLLIPTPSWVSYLPAAKILNKQVIALETEAEDGFKVTPELLAQGLTHLQWEQSILLLNHPHNPTGAVYTTDELEALAKICRRRDVVVIADEIYAQTTFGGSPFTSMAKVYPEGTIVTGGLSKDRSCGGYRFGVAITPPQATTLTANVLKVASSTYSCVAAPIQYAAMEAYSGNLAVEDHIQICTGIHALAARTMQASLENIEGVKSTTPRGGFYLFVDFNDHKHDLQKLGMETCADFCQDLLAVEHTALLPASALLMPEDDFSVRCSYVDYDGVRALAGWRAKIPVTDEEKNSYALKMFPNFGKGVAAIQRYIQTVRQGERPKHMDEAAPSSFDVLDYDVD
jgi:aspartate aminotransferase